MSQKAGGGSSYNTPKAGASSSCHQQVKDMQTERGEAGEAVIPKELATRKDPALDNDDESYGCKIEEESPSGDHGI